jgi:hypothetical protein
MAQRRAIRLLYLDASLAVAAFASLHVVADPRAAAELVDLPVIPWVNRLFYGGAAFAFVVLGALAVRLLSRMAAAGRRWRREASLGALSRCTAGTVAAEFILVLPVMLLVAGIIVQLALIVNASMVVRYAAFTAARSAIVNFEFQYLGNPPLTDVLDLSKKTDPELAAELVLASISPAHADTGNAAAKAMQNVLVQRGGAWPNRGYARRFGYAHTSRGGNEATGLSNLAEGWWESLPPMIPQLDQMPAPFLPSSHLVPPALLGGLPPALTPPNPGVPGGIPLPSIIIPLPRPLPDITIPLPTIPLPAAIRDLIVDAFNTASTLNKDPLSPKRVEILVEYDFAMTIPGMSLIGVTEPAPWDSSVRVFKISRAVELQSTGTRQAGFMAFMPVFDNTPLFWTF